MKYSYLIIIFIVSSILFSCGKKEEVDSTVEETEVVDQVDHSSDVPNDPVFQQQN